MNQKDQKEFRAILTSELDLRIKPVSEKVLGLESQLLAVHPKLDELDKRLAPIHEKLDDIKIAIRSTQEHDQTLFGVDRKGGGCVDICQKNIERLDALEKYKEKLEGKIVGISGVVGLFASGVIEGVRMLFNK